MQRSLNAAVRWPAVAIAPPARMALTAEESARFMRIVSGAAAVRRHYDVFRWLSGDVQAFLPHEILVAAWGDFERGRFQVDITSALPRVRTDQLAYCSLDAFIRQAHSRWCMASREPLQLRPDPEEFKRECALHGAMRGMRSMVVHGVRDQRLREDSLYIALSSRMPHHERGSAHFLAIADALVVQIDGAFRRIAALPLKSMPEAQSMPRLSARERQILESVCQGRSNIDIAEALDISLFTVKNHVQRIFRKMGVNNRTQAAARYGQAVHRSALPSHWSAGE